MGVKHPGGRPPLLNPELQKAILAELESGSSVADAAAIAGLCVDTVNRWVREGSRALRNLQDKGTPVPDNRLAMVEFSAGVKRARAEARKFALGHLTTAMGDNWQAAAWYLERTAPNEYGRKVRAELSGPEGKPIEVAGTLSEAIDAAIQATPALLVDPSDD